MADEALTADPSPTFERLVADFDEALVSFGIPGAVLGIFHRDWQRTVARGVADVTTLAPVTTATAFRIASLTKVFTASALASLAGASLPLTAPITTWYPSFRLADRNASTTVTLAQALSHSGGWVDPSSWPESPDDPRSLADCVAELASTPQLFTPGTLFNYSNSAYQLAGQILATRLDLPYESALQQTLLTPLGLASTGFDHAPYQDRVVASGHVEGESGLEPVDPWQVHPAVHPTGGLHSTVDDLLAFLRFHTGLSIPGTSPLTDDQRLSMQVPHGPGGSLGPISADNVGLGWMRATIGGRQVAMAFGSDAGLAAGMAISPDDEFGFVLLSNADPGLVVASRLLVRAVELFLDTTEPSPLPITLPDDILSRSTGRFTIPGELGFELSHSDGGLVIAAMQGDEPVPGLAGPLTMESASRGWFAVGPMKLYVDLIRDGAGTVEWVRFAARLARRDR